jgi:hypothetical protein
MIGIGRMYYAYNFTEAVVYDISDPEKPKSSTGMSRTAAMSPPAVRWNTVPGFQ